jgi:uncharacterized membrane protein (UPF0182 family)
MVVTMNGDAMSYAPTFKEALARLVSPGAPTPGRAHPEVATATALERARKAFDEYRRLTSEGRFEEAGAQLRAVGEALAPLQEQGALPPR